MQADRERGQAAGLLARRDLRAHLMGIGGVGVAALAYLMHRRGIRVSGCDLKPNRLTDWLQSAGISVSFPHSPSHVRHESHAGLPLRASETATRNPLSAFPGDTDRHSEIGIRSSMAPDRPDWLIRTAAVPPDHPEVAAARAAGLPVSVRAAVLPALIAGWKSIAVAGTHGKTTTTAMTAHILAGAGLDPSCAVGAELPGGGVAVAGGGEWIVVESDESDGLLDLYRPDVGIVTNIDFDHMERFGGIDELERLFDTFARQCRRRVIVCADDPRAMGACGALPSALSYGSGGGCALRLREWKADGLRQRFAARAVEGVTALFDLPVPGRHNALNALAASLAAMEAGVPLDRCAEALKSYRPPGRRLELVAEGRGVRAYQDYAHHPTEIRALIASIGNVPRRRLLAVFQPHRYTRTKALGPDFATAFDGVDRLVLAPVYAASEPPLEGGTSKDLFDHMRRSGRAEVELADSLEEAARRILSMLEPDDLLLLVGAGDIESLAPRIAAWARS